MCLRLSNNIRVGPDVVLLLNFIGFTTTTTNTCGKRFLAVVTAVPALATAVSAFVTAVLFRLQ